jgi:hypothetical protein
MGIQQSQIQCYEKAVRCHGFHENETFNANVVVRHKGSFGSDIGWEKNPDGTYTSHIDNYNYKSGGGEQHYDDAWQNKCYTRYNVEKSKMELEARNIPYVEGRDDNGRTTITARFRTDSNRLSQRGGR